MKISKIFAGAAVAALCLASCTKSLQELNARFPNLESGKIQLSSGETSGAEFTLSDVRDYAISYSVECEYADEYKINVSFTSGYSKGIVTITAPDVIFEDVTFDVKVMFSDSLGGRTSSAAFEVEAKANENVVFFKESANCFLASPGAIAVFPLCKGNTKEKSDVEILELGWQDEKGLFKSCTLYDADNGCVVFNSGKEGNAVVNGIGADSTVVWSWHFWVAKDAPKEVVVGDYTFLDRNLGALNLDEKSELSVGVAYQYGRKDPFTGIRFGAYEQRPVFNAVGDTLEVSIVNVSAETIDNMQNAIENPMIFYNNKYLSGSGNKHNYSWITYDCTQYGAERFTALWNNGGKKSVNDPCPAGYTVASVEAWTAAKALNVTELWDNDYETFDASSIGTYEKYIVGNKKKVQFRGCVYGDLRLTITGEINSNSNAFSFANCIGKPLPTAEVWCRDEDPDFASKINASYFRGQAAKVNTTGNGNYEDISAIKVNALSFTKYGLHYALPVRCVKEK